MRAMSAGTGLHPSSPSDDDPACPASPKSSVPTPTGLVLEPFRALRFVPSVAGALNSLTAPPYDVIDAASVTALESSSDHNVVRLILPRDSPGHTGDRYRRAAELLADWRASGALAPDPDAALYVYEQRSARGHAQRGLLGALALVQPGAGVVLPHENTMSGPVSDRLALYNAVDADLEPIFLVYAGGGFASELVAEVDQQPPLVDVDLPDGLRHRLWAVTDSDDLAGVAADLAPRVAVIADGHHRYATYLQRQADRHAAGAGPGPWDYGLAFLVDASAFGPEVQPIHRVIPGHRPADLAELARAGMVVESFPDLSTGQTALAATAGEPAFLLAAMPDSQTWLLRQPDASRLFAAMPADRSDAWRQLEVSVLHTFVIGALWKLTDDEQAVGYEHDVPSAIRAAVQTSGTAVLLRATPVEAVTAVASAGERMPRKSTLFTPKPRSGLVIRDHRDA